MVVKSVYRVSLRAAQGFVSSVLILMRLDLPVPKYSTICRRRIWRKLHLGFDEQTKEIVAVEITASHAHDSRMLPSLLTQIPEKICQVSGDGAYDTKACREANEVG